jgi:hypothetical protein
MGQKRAHYDINFSHRLLVHIAVAADYAITVFGLFCKLWIAYRVLGRQVNAGTILCCVSTLAYLGDVPWQPVLLLRFYYMIPFYIARTTSTADERQLK